MQNQLSFIPLGGVGDVTKNMYVYECGDEILVVDCGLGFADETMLGVDLLLPDISYLMQSKKKIVGMFFTHGHEDHIGAIPFLLPQLLQKGSFPMYGTPFTASLANEKLKEFGNTQRLQAVNYNASPVRTGDFSVSFLKVTHSIPDTSHLFIRTPIGNFYHGSDYKFDDTPYDGKKTDYEAIKLVAQEGVMCLMSDCLGSERSGRTPTETPILSKFEEEFTRTKGKCIVTTYSSNVVRINQVIAASEKYGRHVCFAGRSLIKIKDVSQKLGYLQMKSTTEIQLDELNKYPDNKVTLLIAGSQGQEASAMVRIANGEHREIRFTPDDTIIFSADPIPGNEILVYQLIDMIAKRGSRVLYSPLRRDFHVSGHGAQEEIVQLMQLVKPKKFIPIGGNFRHMTNYQNIVQSLGYKKSDALLLDDGQEVIFTREGVRPGKKFPSRQVYVDQISGEALDTYILRDRQRLSEGGVVIVLAEIDSTTGQLITNPDIIVRGFTLERGSKMIGRINSDLKSALKGKHGRVINWVYIRKIIGEIVERRVFKDLRRRPLVLPFVIEV